MMSCTSCGMLSRGAIAPDSNGTSNMPNCGMLRASVARKMPSDVVANNHSAAPNTNSVSEPSIGTPSSSRTTTEDSFSVFLGQSDDDISTIIEAYIERLHTRLTDPLTIPTFQLLMMESRRIPGLIVRWNDTVLKRMQARSQELLEECVRSGRVKRSRPDRPF